MLLSAAQSTFLWGTGIKAFQQRAGWPRSSNVLYRQNRRLVITNTRSKSGSKFAVRKKNAAREEAEKKFPRTVRSKELVFKIAKGYRGKTVHRIARQRVAKALEYSYRDRRNRKRDFRRLWIQRINAAARLHGFTYDEFIYGLNSQKVQLNRKLLANIAIHSPDVFQKIAEALPKKPKEPVPA